MGTLRQLAPFVVLVACSATQPAPVVAAAPQPEPAAVPAVADASVEVPDVPAPTPDVPPTPARSPQEALIRALASGATAPVDGIDTVGGFRSFDFATMPGVAPPPTASYGHSGWGTCHVFASNNVDRLRRDVGALVTALDGGASLACEGDDCTARNAASGPAWFLRYTTSDGGPLRLAALYAMRGADAGRNWVERSRRHLRDEQRAHPCR